MARQDPLRAAGHARGPYIATLAAIQDPEPFLLEHSGLPGRRANIALAQAAGEALAPTTLRRFAALDADAAPTGESREFLPFCGVIGLGRLLAEGDASALDELRAHAEDPRWRVREAVAMALQRWGEADFDALLAAMASWAGGSWLARRAAAAALCEPRLLREGRGARVIAVLEEATAGVASADAAQRRSPELLSLRKGLGYCWSVAVAAAPEAGRPAFEALVARAVASGDPDLAWIARENLRKKRLERPDAGWVAALRERLG